MLVKDREEQEVRSNNPLRTVLPEGLGGTLSKGIRWRCAHAPFNPVTISDQNIRFPIPCPIEPDVKELNSPISNQPFLFCNTYTVL